MKKRFGLSEISIDAPFSCHLKLVLVSDLHETNPQKIISLLQKLKPDLILIAGDTFERRSEEAKKNYGWTSKFFYGMYKKVNQLSEWVTKKPRHCSENAYTFIREASKLAPIVMSLGNHEHYLLDDDRRVLNEAGVYLLENQDCEIKVKTAQIRIGGLSSRTDQKWLNEFANKDGYKLLLCHHPEYYKKYLEDKAIDLVLCGHAHGGQIRFFGQGLFSPGQGIFPKYTKGCYEGKLIVSAGCANTVCVPRLNNPCELVLIHVHGTNHV